MQLSYTLACTACVFKLNAEVGYRKQGSFSAPVPMLLSLIHAGQYRAMLVSTVVGSDGQVLSNETRCETGTVDPMSGNWTW